MFAENLKVNSEIVHGKLGPNYNDLIHSLKLHSRGIFLSPERMDSDLASAIHFQNSFVNMTELSTLVPGLLAPDCALPFIEHTLHITDQDTSFHALGVVLLNMDNN